jgi:hypothetical protein
MANRKTTLRGRDARSGEFIPVPVARRRKSTAIVERAPVPGAKPKRSN